MMDHKVRHLQQRLVTTYLFDFKVAIRVHLQEPASGSPPRANLPVLNQKLPCENDKPPISPQARLFAQFWHFSCQLGTFRVIPLILLGIVRRGKASGMPNGCPRFGQNSLSHNLGRYNFYVARGWESKSVEEQQAQAVSAPSPAGPPLTPAQIARQRQTQGLMLSRQRVL